MQRRTLGGGASRPANGSAELSRRWGTPVRSFGSLGFRPKRRPTGRAVARAFVLTVAFGGAFTSGASADDGACGAGAPSASASCATAGGAGATVSAAAAETPKPNNGDSGA